MRCHSDCGAGAVAFTKVPIPSRAGLPGVVIRLHRGRQQEPLPAWEVTPEDIDRVVGDLAAAGRTTSTRREYVQIFKGFRRFLQARKAAKIQAAFGVKLICPVDEFNASRHVGDDSPAELPPPSPERVSEFFEFLKTRIARLPRRGQYPVFSFRRHRHRARTRILTLSELSGLPLSACPAAVASQMRHLTHLRAAVASTVVVKVGGRQTSSPLVADAAAGQGSCWARYAQPEPSRAC